MDAKPRELYLLFRAYEVSYRHRCSRLISCIPHLGYRGILRNWQAHCSIAVIYLKNKVPLEKKKEKKSEIIYIDFKKNNSPRKYLFNDCLTFCKMNKK